MMIWVAVSVVVTLISVMRDLVLAVDYFDAMNTCKNDNWGLPKQTSKTYNGNFDKILRVPCQQQWPASLKPFSDAHDMATVIHYKDTLSYDTFQAVDWIPENKKFYSPGSSWGKAQNTDFKTKKPRSFMSAECSLRQSDGSQWTITRIGPIVTHGGYDWLQIGWDDIWGLKEVLKKHQDGIYIVEQIISPVYANGSMINHPPIHIHHMHVGPAPYVRQRFDQLGCATRGKGCFNPARTLEDHGDYNCVDADGGLECRMESFPEGFAKLITAELGFEGELNDVRPAGSEPLEWYFVMGARWVPKNPSTSADMHRDQAFSAPIDTNMGKISQPQDSTAASDQAHSDRDAVAGTVKSASASASAGAGTSQTTQLRAMSLENIAGPGTYSLFHQKEYLLTFPTPTRYDSIFWYTGRMQSKGDLLRMKVHAHNSIFDQALFFAAAPEDLGLTEANGFSHSKPFLAVETASIRDFRHNQDAKEFFLSNLAEAQAAFDLQSSAPKGGGGTGDTHKGACGYPAAACVRARPEIICQVHGVVEVVPEDPASAASETSQGPRLSAAAGAPRADGDYSGMSLDQTGHRAWYADYAYDRRAPTCCIPWQWESGQVFTVVGFNRYKGFPLASHAVTDEIPETLAGHVGFWMSYDTMTSPESYHWGYSLYNHFENGSLASVLDMKGYQKIAIAFNGGTSENWNDPSQEPYFLLIFGIYQLLTHLPLFAVAVLLVGGACCCRICRTRGTLRPVKLSCDYQCPSGADWLVPEYFRSDRSEISHSAAAAAAATTSVRAEMVRPHRAPRDGGEDDLPDQDEERVSFLA